MKLFLSSLASLVREAHWLEDGLTPSNLKNTLPPTPTPLSNPSTLHAARSARPAASPSSLTDGSPSGTPSRPWCSCCRYRPSRLSCARRRCHPPPSPSRLFWRRADAPFSERDPRRGVAGVRGEARRVLGQEGDALLLLEGEGPPGLRGESAVFAELPPHRWRLGVF